MPSIPLQKTRSKNYQSATQLIGAIGLYIGLWSVALYGPTMAPGWTVLIAVAPIIGAFKVRIFNLQHDCAHRSYFTRPAVNDVVGLLLGIVTLTPHHYWRRNHLLHHATSGNLDQRGYGDIRLYTVNEFQQLPPTRKLIYRLYRNPFVFLAVGSVYYFIIKMRMPFIAPSRTRQRASIHFTNASWMVIYVLVFSFYKDPMYFIVMHGASQFIGGVLGLWLFFVQHQFDDGYWRRSGQWTFKDAAQAGSSYLKLPAFFEWFIAHINLHHVHHLDPRIPNYKLKAALTETATAHPPKEPITFLDSLRVFRLKLWDETSRRMVGFPNRAGRLCDDRC